MTLKQFVDLELGTSLGAENVIIYLKMIIIITKVMIIIVIQNARARFDSKPLSVWQ